MGESILVAISDGIQKHLLFQKRPRTTPAHSAIHRPVRSIMLHMQESERAQSRATVIKIPAVTRPRLTWTSRQTKPLTTAGYSWLISISRWVPMLVSTNNSECSAPVGLASTDALKYLAQDFQTGRDLAPQVMNMSDPNPYHRPRWLI